MRTTIRLNDHLLQQAKQVAADTGRTLTSVIEDALREAFARREPSQSRARVKLPTFDGGGLMPGVDLDNSAGLLDIMEEGDAPV